LYAGLSDLKTHETPSSSEHEIEVWSIFLRVVSVKTQPINNHVLRYKNEVRRRSIDSPKLPRHTLVKVTLTAKPVHTPAARKSCSGANYVFPSPESMFILEYYFASKSFATVRKAFSSAYPDKELPNKTLTDNISGHRKCFCVLENVVDICCSINSSKQIKTKIKELIRLVILMSPNLANTVVFRAAF
jgi:hypothetical protein